MTNTLANRGGSVVRIEDVLKSDGHPKIWPDGSIVKRAFDTKDGRTDWRNTVEVNPWPVKRGYEDAVLIDKIAAQFMLCFDCEAMPGEFHQPGCDFQTCPLCGYRLITCACTKDDSYLDSVEALGGYIAWAGHPVGYREAIEYGFFQRFTLIAAGHTFAPCKVEDVGSQIDLRRLIQECEWNKERRRWVKRQTEVLSTSEPI